MRKGSSSTINIQDSYFYQLRKDERAIDLHLMTGDELHGVVRRFDRYAIVLATDRGEELVYKHAIVRIAPAG